MGERSDCVEIVEVVILVIFEILIGFRKEGGVGWGENWLGWLG